MKKNVAKQKLSLENLKKTDFNPEKIDVSGDSNKNKALLPPGIGLIKNQKDAACYISEMLFVLCNIAKDVDLAFLNYLLEMAREESLTHAHATATTLKKSGS